VSKCASKEDSRSNSQKDDLGAFWKQNVVLTIQMSLKEKMSKKKSLAELLLFLLSNISVPSHYM
jgi:hypothetical protein